MLRLRLRRQLPVQGLQRRLLVVHHEVEGRHGVGLRPQLRLEEDDGGVLLRDLPAEEGAGVAAAGARALAGRDLRGQ